MAPQSAAVARGFARDDLFTVVLEHFLTDTADHADIVLPATTQLEHLDVHKSYGHLYQVANNPAIAPLGQALPNTEIFRRIARRMGFTDDCFADTDEQIAACAFRSCGAAAYDWEALRRDGWQRLEVPQPYAPFAQGGFPTPSGRCEFSSPRLAAQGMDPVPDYVPPYEGPNSNARAGATLPAGHDFAAGAQFPQFVASSTWPACATPRASRTWTSIRSDAAPRSIADGALVEVFNDRGCLRLRARVSDRPRPGVVVALSVWWKKLAGDGKNANEVTHQGLTDLGAGATFYDCLVQVRPAAAPAAS